MKGKTLLFTTMFFLLTWSSCSGYQSGNCSTIKINPQYEPIKAVLRTKRGALVIGLDEEPTDFRSKESVLFNVSFNDDVLNEQYQDTVLRIKGENRAVSKTSNSLFMVNEEFKERLSFSNTSSRLYKMNLENLKINEVYDFGKILVKWLHFDNDDKGYSVVRFSNNAKDYGILYTNNGGALWDTLKVNRTIDHVFDTSNKVYFIAQSQPNHTNLIYSFDKSDLSLNSMTIDFNIKNFFVDHEGGFWLIGKENNETILKRLSNGKLEHVSTISKDSEVYPKSIYISDGFVAVLLGKSDNESLGGFGSSSDKLWFSRDRGMTWEEQILNGALYIRNLTFNKDKNYLVYLGRGRLAACNVR